MAVSRPYRGEKTLFAEHIGHTGVVVTEARVVLMSHGESVTIRVAQIANVRLRFRRSGWSVAVGVALLLVTAAAAYAPSRPGGFTPPWLAAIPAPAVIVGLLSLVLSGRRVLEIADSSSAKHVRVPVTWGDGKKAEEAYGAIQRAMAK